MAIPAHNVRLVVGFVACVALSVVALSGCNADSHRSDKSAQASYFAKKMECHKYETEILKDMEKNSKFVSQSLERIFYSPSLDTCVAIIYTLPNSGTGKIQAEIRDVLTEKTLWLAEYPMTGGKSYEQIIADADAEIQRKGWGEK